MTIPPSLTVLQAAQQLGGIYPADAGLLEAVEETRASLCHIPQQFTFTFHVAPSPSAFGPGQPDVFLGLLRQVEAWVGCFAYSVLYRLLQLLDDVVSGLNEARYLRTVNAARSMLETDAFVHHFVLKLEEANQLVTRQDDPPTVILGLATMLQTAVEFAQVSRMNWRAFPSGEDEDFFKKYRLPASAVPDITGLLDKLPQGEPGSARFRYALLCDFVHPNAGSHLLLIDKARAVTPTEMSHTLHLDPGSVEALLVVLHVITAPVKASTRALAARGLKLERHHKILVEWRRRCEQSVIT